VTELDSLMTAGLSDMMAGAGSVTASIGGTTVTGIYTPGEKSGELGIGGLVTPAPAEFVYPATAASAPAQLKTITVANATKRVMSTQEDGGLITVTLGDPDDVR
jgi:hypothetical protein